MRPSATPCVSFSVARSAATILQDILESAEAIASYTRQGKGAFDSNAMLRDAVVARLIQIGQAVKDAQSAGLNLSAHKPGIPWRSVAGMRDRLTHRYWAIETSIVWAAVESDLPKLAQAVRELLAKQASPRRRKPRKKVRAASK